MSEKIYDGEGPYYLEISESTGEGTSAPGVEPAGTAAASQDELEWWQEPGLPFDHKPGRKDFVCLGLISAVAIYSLIMLPLQPVVLGWAPQVLGALGYRTGMILTGVQAYMGDHWWPLVLGLGTLLSAKFDWIYWWAGKLWGRGIIEMWSGKSERAKKRNARAEKIARKYETLAIVITYLPIPIPAAVIYAVLGEAGTSLKKFLGVDIASALVMQSIYLALGWWIGEPAVKVMEVYTQYMWYISFALLVGVVVFAVWSTKRQMKEQ
ncbi:MAG: VTT domain-containing protein [Propionibacteriaceae bacterium]|nr:VTT domain-containing protein [Propionibacteriaceae bacterium]